MTKRITMVSLFFTLLLLTGASCGKVPLVKMDNDFQLAKLQTEIKEMKNEMSANIELRNSMQAKITAQNEMVAKLNAQGNIGQGNTNTAQDIQAGKNAKVSVNDTAIFKWWAIFVTILCVGLVGIIAKSSVAKSKTIQAFVRMVKKEKENV